MKNKNEEKSIEDYMKSVWSTIDSMSKETKKMKKEFEEQRKKRESDLDKYFKRREQKLEAELKKRQKTLDAELKRREIEDEKTKAELNAEIRRFNESMGYYDNTIGVIAEEYFFNSFKAGKTNFFGEHFDEIEKNVKGIKKDFKDEYDILLINGSTIGIIEVKTKAHENDIPKILNKAVTFRANFPEYINHKVYIALASLAFYPDLEHVCNKNGVAIIKQVGDNLVIFDEKLKYY